MTHLTAPEVLNDLIEVNNSRIARYEAAMTHIDPRDTELRFLFASIIGESHQNKIYLATELHAMGEHIDLSPARRGEVFARYQQMLPAANTADRDQLLAFSEAVEAAVLEAYHAAHQSEDLAAYLKDILTDHESRIDTFRHAILVMRDHTD